MTLSDWSSLGSAVGGIATAILVLAGFVVGLPGINDWRAKKRAERDHADEQAKQIRLDRERHVRGWSPGMVNSWEVAVVADPAEIAEAQTELTTSGGYTAFVLLRAADANQADNLRMIAQRDGHLAREPQPGEREALERGFAAPGVPSGRHGRGGAPAA